MNKRKINMIETGQGTARNNFKYNDNRNYNAITAMINIMDIISIVI